MKKAYLGDSVYARNENGMLALTTENGYGPSNEIFLEPEVIEAMFMFLERTRNLKITVGRTSSTEAKDEGSVEG